MLVSPKTYSLIKNKYTFFWEDAHNKGTIYDLDIWALSDCMDFRGYVVINGDYVKTIDLEWLKDGSNG